MCYGKEGGCGMSAYSEWKAGLITDAEYNTICRKEWFEDRHRLWAEGHDWDVEEEDHDDADE